MVQTILPKKQMTEEDIKLQYITPAVTSKWDIKKITMETQITDGKINLKGNLRVREKPKRADYVLYLCANYPIAVIEAKDNTHSISHGLQQAMEYAKMLDLPFAFSSNGDGFAEHDFLTGAERQFSMDEFPTEADLIARYKQEVNQGTGLTPVEEAAINQPYYSSQTTYPPRYYQRIAINRTMDAIAKGQQRLLLVMAPFGFRLAYDTRDDILYCAEAIVRIVWHKSDPLAIYVSELLNKLFFEQDRRQDVIKEENKGWPI